jgi:hypothetical protein
MFLDAIAHSLAVLLADLRYSRALSSLLYINRLGDELGRGV